MEQPPEISTGEFIDVEKSDSENKCRINLN